MEKITKKRLIIFTTTLSISFIFGILVAASKVFLPPFIFFVVFILMVILLFCYTLFESKIYQYDELEKQRMYRTYAAAGNMFFAIVMIMEILVRLKVMDMQGFSILSILDGL